MLYIYSIKLKRSVPTVADDDDISDDEDCWDWLQECFMECNVLLEQSPLLLSFSGIFVQQLNHFRCLWNIHLLNIARNIIFFAEATLEIAWSLSE